MVLHEARKDESEPARKGSCLFPGGDQRKETETDEEMGPRKSGRKETEGAQCSASFLSVQGTSTTCQEQGGAGKDRGAMITRVIVFCSFKIKTLIHMEGDLGPSLPNASRVRSSSV